MESVEEGRAAVGRMSKDDTGFPYIVESMEGYNIVSWQRENWVIEQSFGPSRLP